MKLVDFCPAAASARRMANLETRIAGVQALMAEASAHAPRIDMLMMERLNRLYLDLALEADEERNRLASAEIRSLTGALAALFAAIRDARVADDTELRRARKLEGAARRFLDSADYLDGEMAAQMSQTTTSALMADNAPPSSLPAFSARASGAGIYAPVV